MLDLISNLLSTTMTLIVTEYFAPALAVTAVIGAFELFFILIGIHRIGDRS